MDKTYAVSRAFSEHSRSFLNNSYVYPVFSRRSEGVSIGINLNPDKICNFNCIYCQVDRRIISGETKSVDIQRVLQELRNILNSFGDKSFYSHPKFKDIPKKYLVLKDIAFSGDGEPSLFPELLDLTQGVISVKNSLGFPKVKLVLITNTTGFSRPNTMKALDILYSDQGDVWAKLDAGTDAYFRLVCRSAFPLDKILDNILHLSLRKPVMIQTCFMKINNAAPSRKEIEAYCQRLINIKNKNGKLKLIQIYTIARKPTEGFVGPLENEEMDDIVDIVRNKSGLEVNAYYHS